MFDFFTVNSGCAGGQSDGRYPHLYPRCRNNDLTQGADEWHDHLRSDKIIVRDRCVIEANAMIVHPDLYSLDPSVRSSPDDAWYAISKPVVIGSDVFIGGGSTILKGVSIGIGAIIDSNSVVKKDVPAGVIAAGNLEKLIV